MTGLAIALVLVSAVALLLQQRLVAARRHHRILSFDARVAEEKLARVLESITDGFLALDASWRITHVNRRGEQMLGRSRAELVGRFALDVFPEGVGSTIHHEMEQARAARSPVDFEAYYPPGSRWFEVRGFPAADETMTVYFRDVTRRKRAQEALALQARMLDTVRQGVIGVEPDGNIFYWNRAAEEQFGWAAADVVGKTTLAIFQHGDDAAAASDLSQRLIAGEPWSEETTLRRRDDSTFPALVIDSPIRDEKGAVLGMVRVVTDISERYVDQQAQRFLANAGSELASTLDFDALLPAVALLAVPTLGDCCLIDVVEEEGVSQRSESTWTSALAHGGALRLSRRTYQAKLRAAPLLRGGEATLITNITPELLQTLAVDAEERARLERAGVRSVVVAPLKARGRTLGTLAVACTGRVYRASDAALITEFVRRVAFAADNAILYETARLANQAKSDFLAVMSHELRTPLTTVMGYTDLLLAEVSGALSPQSHNYVDRIRAAAWHLLGLIEQILIYARVEIGREQVHVERVALDYVLRDAASLIEPVAAEKGLRFILEAPPEAAYVDTDLTKLRQILLNLLSNAVKFTESGDVILSARIDERTVEFSVHDTGIGIAPEHLEHIFDSFWQVDQSSTRRAGGTGLGLSVARKLARLLGGDVVATSSETGTTFVITMPRGPQPPAHARRQLDASAASS